jgi:hypothetical protein
VVSVDRPPALGGAADLLDIACRIAMVVRNRSACDVARQAVLDERRGIADSANGGITL